MPGAELTGPPEPLHQLRQDVRLPDLPGQLEDSRNDLERQARRGLQSTKVKVERTGRIARQLGHAGSEHVGPGKLDVMRTGLFNQCPRTFHLALQQRVLGKLAQIVCSHPTTLQLNGRRKLVEDLQGVGPLTLLLVDPLEVVEGGIPVLTRGRQLLEQALGAIHEPGALVVQRQLEGRLVVK